MPLILGAASAVSTAFSVDNSCRFDGSSSYMHKTPGGAGNVDRWTFSFWVKGNPRSGGTQILTQGSSSSNYTSIEINGTGNFNFGQNTGSWVIDLSTDRHVGKDPSAWYHFVVAVDTGQATDTNRAKLYINGTQYTWDRGTTFPAQDLDTLVNSTEQLNVAYSTQASAGYLDGYLAEVCLIDGTQYAASDFGEFDEDSPTIWKPIDVSGLTFGTNGFYLDFKDSANLGNDANGGTDLTEVNLAAADQATDSPTNNFCTLNPVDNYLLGSTFSEGNCKIATTGTEYGVNSGTLAPSGGKWYFECELTANVNTDNMMGITAFIATSGASELGASQDQYSYYGGGQIWANGGATITGLSTYTAGDIISIAFDLENNFFYAAKNGTWQNSADPTSGATGTGGQAVTPTASQTAAGHINAYLPGLGDYDTTGYSTFSANFGGCSAFDITSANQDGNGYGNFEYAVPSGYLAICTKNLGSDGG